MIFNISSLHRRSELGVPTLSHASFDSWWVKTSQISIGSLYNCNPSRHFYPCNLHRSLINLTPGDGFHSQVSSEVMGIQSVTNSGASTELALLGVQVILHSPCQPPTAALPKWPWRLEQDYFGVQVRDQLFCCPLVTLQFLQCDFFFLPALIFCKCIHSLSPSDLKGQCSFCKFLSSLIIFILTEMLCLWKTDVI